MTRGILLVNTNVARPPVSPVGLEYVAESLVEAGAPPHVLDLSFETDWKASLQRELEATEPMAVGLSVRNTDDCSFASGKSFLPWISEVVAEVKKFTAAPVFLGGIGFSILPEATLQATRADFGIEGDGEEALVALTGSLIKSEDFTHLPGMVYWQNGEVVSNPRADTDLNRLPVPRRRIFDNRRYQQLGAMVGVETKRGCTQNCIYCPEPSAKGSKVRLRPPEIVVRELQDLLEQGVSWFYLCDSEFNLPPRHARDMCRAIIEKGLSEKISLPYEERRLCRHKLWCRLALR